MRLIIFDFDDTIIDNTLLDLDSFRYLTKNYRLDFIDDQKILRWRRKGMLAKNIIKKMTQKNKNYELELLIKARLDYLKKGGLGLKLVRPKPCVNAVLRKLKEDGYHIVIATSRTNFPIIKKILKKIQVDEFIDSVYYFQHFVRNKSKYPENYNQLKKNLYELAISDYEMKSKIDRTIVVGNLKSDIIPAIELKIENFAIKGSYRFDTGIKKLTKTLESLDELFRYI